MILAESAPQACSDCFLSTTSRTRKSVPPICSVIGFGSLSGSGRGSVGFMGGSREPVILPIPRYEPLTGSPIAKRPMSAAFGGSSGGLAERGSAPHHRELQRRGAEVDRELGAGGGPQREVAVAREDHQADALTLLDDL